MSNVALDDQNFRQTRLHGYKPPYVTRENKNKPGTAPRRILDQARLLKSDSRPCMLTLLGVLLFLSPSK